MSYLDPVLAEAREFDGRPRFYPPGLHPATARLRAQLKALRAHGVTEDHDLVVHINDTLAAFEEGESFAKWVYLVRVHAWGRRR